MRWRKDRIAEIVKGLMAGYGFPPYKHVRCPACNREDVFIPDSMLTIHKSIIEAGGPAHRHWDCLGCHARVSVFYMGHRFILKTHYPEGKPK